MGFPVVGQWQQKLTVISMLQGHRKTSKDLKHRQRGSRREANAKSKEHLRTSSCSRSHAHPNVGVRNWAWDANKEPGPSSGAKGTPKKHILRPQAKAKTNPFRGKKKDSNKLNMQPMNSDLKVVSQNIHKKKLLWEIEEITNSFWQPKTDFR